MNPGEQSIETEFLEKARACWDLCLYQKEWEPLILAPSGVVATRTSEVRGADTEQLKLNAKRIVAHRIIDEKEISGDDYYDELNHMDLKWSSVLEFGAGAGGETLLMAERGAGVTACDIVASNVMVVKRVLEGFLDCRAVFLESYDDIDRLGKFDLIYCQGVLHHIPNPFVNKVVAKLGEHLKEEGRFLILLYTHRCHPSPRIDGEGFYARGYSLHDVEELFGNDFLIAQHRLINNDHYMWVTLQRRGPVVRVPMGLISTQLLEEYFDSDYINNLAADMEKNGQKEPVLVRFHGDHYFLEEGAHRFFAARQLKWQEIDAKIVKIVITSEKKERVADTRADILIQFPVVDLWVDLLRGFTEQREGKK